MATAGNTVQIVVQAQTQDALAAMKTFASQSAGALNVLSAGTKQVAADAAKASEHIAGMAYYFRSGIDAIRFAAAGGGERAGFYAIDEGVRALLASGMKLGTLVPILGALGAAVGAGVLVWHEWNKAQEEAEQHAKDLASAWKELPKLIQQISDMQNVGILGPGAAAEYADYATGRKKLYVDRISGQVTPSANSNVPQEQAGELPYSVLAQGTPYNGGISVPNEQASLAQALKYVQTNATAGVSDQQLDALKELRKESQQMEEERLSGIDKEKQAVINRYANEREEMNKNLILAKAQLDQVAFDHDATVLKAQADLAQSYKDQDAELAALDQKRDDDQAAATEKILDRLRKRRTEELKQLDEEASKQAEADKQHEEALKRQGELQQEIARGKIEAQLKGIEDNPFLSTQQKTAESIPLYQQQLQLNASRIGDLAHTATTTPDVSAQLEAQKQIVELTQQQVSLQQKLNAAEGASSWTYQLQAAVDKMRDIPTIQQQIGSLLEGTMKTGMDSVASNLTRVIEGTEKWRKALLNIAESVMTQLLQGIIQVIEKLLVQLAVDIAIKAVTGGAFAEGGRPDVGKVALVGERGPELFIPDTAGTVIPAHQTAAILQGRGDAGGGSNVNVEGHKITQHFYDSRPHPRDYLASSQGEQQFIDLARKNRTKIGIGT